jgi:hypothetical protein
MFAKIYAHVWTVESTNGGGSDKASQGQTAGPSTSLRSAQGDRPVARIPEAAVLIGGEFAPDDIGSEACGAADVTGEMALMGETRGSGDLGHG